MMAEKVWLTTAEARRRFEAAALAVVSANVCQGTNPSKWSAIMPRLVDRMAEAMAEYRDTQEHWQTPKEQR
jgi:hypothetical protein